VSRLKKNVEDYIINRFTMAILPSEDRMSSVIYELNDLLHVEQRPIDVIEQSCRYFGSSYHGRKEGTRDLMGVTHKPPIVIDPANAIYFFPTTSSTRPQCIWLSHSYVKKHSKTANNATIVTFTNGEELTVNMSIGSFENQFYRTAQLRTIISTRIENEQRKMEMLLMPKGESKFSQLYEQIIREIQRYS